MEIKIRIDEIKTGDILLVSSKSWLARTIQKFQKNKWNHAGLIIEIWGKLWVCESERRGICLTPLTDYLNSDKELLICKPTYYFNQKVLTDLALSHCGWTKYDYTSLLFFQAIKQLTGKWIGKKGDKAQNTFYCSEFVAYVHNSVYPFVFENYWETSPEDIFNNKEFLQFKLK